MTFDGTFTKKYRIPRRPSPDALIAGPDGALWISQGNFGQVSRLDVGLDPPVTAEGTTFSAKAGASANAHGRDVHRRRPERPRRATTASRSTGATARSRTARVRRAADGSFEVRGRHTYYRKGTYKVVVRITDGVGKGLDAKVESRAYVTR